MKLIIILFCFVKKKNYCEKDCNVSDIKYVLCEKPMIQKCDNLLYSILVTPNPTSSFLFSS